MTAAELATWYALRQGAVSARPLAEIAFSEGLSRRAVEQAIEGLRADLHEPICANADGYFEAATVEELEAYIAAFDRRLASMWRTRRGLKAARRRMQEEATGTTQIKGRWAA
jgi:hypothetical protein